MSNDVGIEMTRRDRHELGSLLRDLRTSTNDDAVPDDG
jgi:hypothetical protein